MKTVRKTTFNIKKHIIHILVAGAMAISWGAVSHANNYMHKHLRVTHTRKSKSEFAPDTPNSEDELPTQTSTPLAKSVSTPPILTTTTKDPLKSPTKMKLKMTSGSLISAVAAKVGVNITQDKEISITQTKIDTGFIRKVEGSVLKGYVPLASTTNSGVTIADGFDLGQMHLSEFNKLPISDALKTKLQPYIGLTRFQAKNFLKAHPLTINNDELTQLNIVAANKILQPLMKVYDQSSGKSFLDLPAEAQTAIFSYAYQHGPGFMHRSSAKQLWHSFTTQNWQKASTLLRSSKMYAARRAQEAQLLEKIA